MKLFEHQEKFLNDSSEQASCALFWDMGLGKTLTACLKASEIGYKTLIISPLSVMGQWIDQVQALGYKIDNLREVDKPRRDWAIINYDSVWRKKPDIYNNYDVLILDESQWISNDKSKRTKYILKNLNMPAVILLSGTPDGGHYENLFTQLKMLGLTMTKKEFYKNFITTALVEFVPGVKSRIITGYKNVDKLKELMNKLGCYFLKTEECIDLPEKNNITIKLDASREYRKFKKDLVIQYKDKVMAGTSTMAEMINLRLLSSFAKKSAVIDLLKSSDQPQIIFYNFNDELEMLTECCAQADRDFFVVNGQMKQAEAWDLHPKGVLLCQYQAGATGLNLQHSDTIIYLAPCYSSQLFEQSKKRIHRIGQKNTCKYYYLVCENSIDGDIYESLKNKKDYSDQLFFKGL